MESVSIVEAKAHLSQLIERAAAGTPVQITRRGKPIAHLVAVPAATPEPPRQKIDITMLQALTDKMPMQTESAGDFVRRMRDEDRY